MVGEPVNNEEFDENIIPEEPNNGQYDLDRNDEQEDRPMEEESDNEEDENGAEPLYHNAEITVNESM